MAMGKLAAMLGEATSEEPMDDAEEYSPEDDVKESFMAMCQAIQDGDFEAAWTHYQECK